MGWPSAVGSESISIKSDSPEYRGVIVKGDFSHAIVSFFSERLSFHRGSMNVVRGKAKSVDGEMT